MYCIIYNRSNTVYLLVAAKAPTKSPTKAPTTKGDSLPGHLPAAL